MARGDRRSEIARLLRKRERHGLTYRELSEESGIPIPTLSWWSRKLREERESAAECELVAVEVVEDEPAERPALIEIVIGGRLSVLVPPAASGEHLQRVLRAVTTC